jgi:1,4-dihydroxy-2-naphthoate octaprenyltransferase
MLARVWSAAKPASWPKLLVPFALGQAMGTERGFSFIGFALGLAFTIFDLIFIVFLNDWGDREVDALKRRMFGDRCGKKTIADGILSARTVLALGLAGGAGAAATGVCAELVLGRSGVALASLFALAIFAAYSLPPVRLNYRGGGELLEMLGVGVVLPWLNAYLQGGALVPSSVVLLGGFALLSLSSAIASGLADERSDRRGGKRTFVTMFGNALGRRAAEATALLGASAWALAGALTDALPWWLAAAAAMMAFWYVGAAIAKSRAASTDAFEAQRRYKASLHAAIWRGALVAAMLLAWKHLALDAR